MVEKTSFSKEFRSEFHRGRGGPQKTWHTRLAHYGITGQIWQQLRTLHLHHKIRVLHGHIPSSSFVNIEKGLPEGGRLSPLEWCLYIADPVHDLQQYFPHISLSPPQHLILMISVSHTLPPRGPLTHPAHPKLVRAK